MFFEDYKAKGIGMQKDAPLRFADCIHFYSNYVNSTPLSKKLLGYFYNPEFGKEPSYSMKNAPTEKKRMLYYLSLGKEWSWCNKPQENDYEIHQYLKEFPVNSFWAKDFLRSAGINYIVLENHDSPSTTLTQMTREVYRNDSIQILEVIPEQI